MAPRGVGGGEALRAVGRRSPGLALGCGTRECGGRGASGSVAGSYGDEDPGPAVWVALVLLKTDGEPCGRSGFVRVRVTW